MPNKMIRVRVDTGFVRVTQEETNPVPDNWDDFSPKEQEDFLYACATDMLYDYCSGYAEVIEGEDE